MTGRIDGIVASIPSMGVAERKEWRRKAEDVLRKSPDHPDALRILTAFDSVESGPEALPRRLISTGRIGWEPHDAAAHAFAGYFEGRAVARIVKHATHTANRKGVYTVEVEGKTLPLRYAQIEEARYAGERAWGERGA